MSPVVAMRSLCLRILMLLCTLFVPGFFPAARAAVPEGFLDVTAAPYSADKTGLTDSTLALQTAINDARDNNLVLWLPVGTYLVSDRLIVDQPDNDSGFPVVIMGSTVNPANRATIVLAANSPGFNDPLARRAVLHYFNLGTVDAEDGNTDLYNQAVVGVDFKIRPGNAGAVALRMQAAEGSTLQDINIDLTESGHTGIWGVPGSGGSTHKVTITGGVIGIDTRKVNQTASQDGGGSQPTVVITGSTFVNQSGQALYASSRGATVLVGCRIQRNTTGAAVRLRKHWVGQPFDATFHLVDSSVEYSAYHAANTVIDFQASHLGRSFHLENSYVLNGHQVFASSAPANPAGWRRYHRLAVHELPSSRNQAIAWQPKETIYIEGVAAGDVFSDFTDEAPPPDLQSRHQWHADFPTWEHPGVVNVKTLGVVGDGITDDWAALQAAITAHEKLFFPKGTYQVSKTLDLRPDSKLVGAYHAFTRLRAISTLANRFAGTTEALGDQPIIRTADSASADTILAFLGIRRLFPLALHNPTPVGNYALEWRCAGTSLLRHVEVESRANTNLRPDMIAKVFYGYDLATNPININHPQLDFQPGHWAWPVSEPTVQIRGNGGGRWFNFWMHGRQGLRSHVPFVRVEGTSQPLNIYHLHIQQQDSVNHAEFINASNVSVYGAKGEVKGTFAYFEGCNNVRLIGHGGKSSPDPAVNPPFLFRFINTDNFLVAGLGDTINEGATEWVGGIYDRWVHTHIRHWKPILDQHASRAEVQIPWDTRPIIYVRGDPSPQPVTGGSGNSIAINFPADNSSHTHGATAWFFGTAIAASAGNISHLGAWSSSLDGPLGSGASVSASGLSLGLHTINFTAIAPGGAVLSKSITVSVEPAPPSTQTVVADNEPVADAFVRGENSSNKSRNYGSNPAIETRSAGPGPGYLRFSLAGLPASITAAKLVLATSAADTGTLTFHEVASTTWTETGITWNNRPALGSSLGAITFTGATATELQLDVTAYINARIASGQANFGTSTTASLLRFYSREGALPPHLEITYTTTAPTNAAPVVAITAPASPLTSPQGQTLAFTGTATDSEDGNLAASAKWYSSRDGFLGAGPSLSVSTLSIGVHTITLHVMDAAGKSSANTATVTVNPPPPVITTHPQPALVSVGGSATLSVTATGTDLAYQWYAGASGNTASPVSGATSASFTTPALAATTTYWVRVSNAAGFVNSTAATVTVNDPPSVAVSSPVAGSIVPLGTIVTLSASATDTEDGNLSSAIAWSSSLDGALGTGASLQRANLTIGRHVLTATVADSGARTATSSVTLEVRPAALFNQPFSGAATVSSYVGAADHLFDFLGTDTNATNNRATLSIADGRFRNTIAYTNDANVSQISAARLTRRTNLPVEQNFAVVYATARLAPQAWPSGDTNFFGFTIGQNFRAGIFTPSAGTGNGPAFASLTFQARGGLSHTFRTTGVGGNSANLTVTPSGGVYTVDFVFAANAGATARTFRSPTGYHLLQPGSVSVWLNGALHLNNVTSGVTAADLVNFSFSNGGGVASSFATGSVFNGFYEFDHITVATLSGFVTEAPPNTAPTVAITTPANATTFTQGAGVAFTGTATDPEDGNLAASATWSSSINGALGTGASLSTSSLSVGVHTITFAAIDSGGLHDTDQITLTVQAPNTPPTVAITAPTNNTTITQGDNVTFTGTATDTRDGNLAASATWSSSLDGSLGAGGSFSTTTLSRGVHTVTYSVTDSGGLAGSAQITLTVAEPATSTTFNGSNLHDAANWTNGLPLVTRSKTGTINVSGAYTANSALSWRVNHTGGTLTSAFNRAMGAFDASSPGTVWNITGGRIDLGAANLNRGTIGSNYAYILTVNAGGAITAGAIQNTTGSTINLQGGSITLGGTHSLAGGVLNLYSGTFSAAGLSTNGDSRIHFFTGSTATLAIAGFDSTDYENLWTGGRLRFNDANTGAFGDRFQVVGSTLSLHPADPYAAWKTTHALSGDAALDTADPDGDGVPNLLEYALGTAPDSSASRPNLESQISNLKLQLTFTPQVTHGLRFFVDASSDLAAWTSTEITSLLVSGNPYTFTDSADLGSASPPRRFLRLRVSLTP